MSNSEIRRAFGALSADRSPIGGTPPIELDILGAEPRVSFQADMLTTQPTSNFQFDPDITGTISPEQRAQIMARLYQADQPRPRLPDTYVDEVPTYRSITNDTPNQETQPAPKHEDPTLLEDFFDDSTGIDYTIYRGTDTTDTLEPVSSNTVDLTRLTREQARDFFRSLQGDLPTDTRSPAAARQRRGKRVLRTLLVSVLAGSYSYGLAEQKDFTPSPIEIVRSIPEGAEKNIDFWYRDGKGPSITEAVAIFSNITHKETEDDKFEENDDGRNFTPRINRAE